MPQCAVKNCKNSNKYQRKNDGVTFHIFPNNLIMREKWRKIIAKNRDEDFYKPKMKDIVCSLHFLASDMYETAKGFKRLKKSAVPHPEIPASTPKEPTYLEIKLEKLEEPIDIATSYSADVLEIDMKQSAIDIPASTPKEPTYLEIKLEKLEEPIDIATSNSADVLEIDMKQSAIDVSTSASSSQFLLQGQNTESPTAANETESLSDADTELETPETRHYKKALAKCHSKLKIKNNQLRNLRKQVKRLRKSNASMEKSLKDLKNKISGLFQYYNIVEKSEE